jgi:hypothetical protein
MVFTQFAARRKGAMLIGGMMPLLAFLGACSGTDSMSEVSDQVDAADPGGFAVQGFQVSPATPQLTKGDTLTFQAGEQLEAGSTSSKVEWTATGGIITSGGVYTAGDSTGTFRVVAKAGNATDTSVVTIAGTVAEGTMSAAIATMTGVGKITAKLNSAMCLDVAKASNSNGAIVLLWGCNGGANQQWTATSSGELRVFGDKCLDAPGSRGQNGDKLQIWTCNGGANQRWQYTTAGELRGLNGKCIDLWGSKAVDGATIALYNCWGGSNQAWNVPGGSTTPTPTPTPTPIPTDPGTCSGYSYSRLVPVSTAAQLASAMQNARPGDKIQLADGSYFSWFNITASGTASAPIILCGSRRAVVGSGSQSSGNGIVLGASNWRLVGFTLSNSQTGIAVIGGSDNVLDNMEVRDVGQTGVHLRGFSKRNRIVNSWIHHTGRRAGAYGEGVYVGSWEGQWCERSGCQPDRSDANVVTRTTFGPYVTAQNVDIKEGTTGTVLTYNTFSGVGMVPDNYNRSWVFNGGNAAVITDNIGSVSLVHGYENSAPWQGGGTTWGVGNTYRRNVSDVRASGYGFSIMGGTSGRNVIGCDNKVTNAGSGFANVPCTS